MTNNINVLEKTSKKASIVKKLHKNIMSINRGICFYTFPQYVRYSNNDFVFAVVYFRGKFVLSDDLDLGLNLKTKPKPSEGFLR